VTGHFKRESAFAEAIARQVNTNEHDFYRLLLLDVATASVVVIRIDSWSMI
jgi:hypothetical protein